jgi:hypothetical protein
MCCFFQNNIMIANNSKKIFSFKIYSLMETTNILYLFVFKIIYAELFIVINHQRHSFLLPRVIVDNTELATAQKPLKM